MCLVQWHVISPPGGKKREFFSPTTFIQEDLSACLSYFLLILVSIILTGLTSRLHEAIKLFIMQHLNSWHSSNSAEHC